MVRFRYRADVYPTAVRSSGLGVCNVASRIGAIGSPFVANQLQAVALWAPPLVFIVACLVAIATVLSLGDASAANAQTESVEDDSLVEPDAIESANTCTPVIG